MIHQPLRRIGLTGGLLLLLALPPAQALPRFSSTADAEPSATAQRVRRHRVVRPAAPPSSSETTRERERRLLRECKGRPNAGACLGYAS